MYEFVDSLLQKRRYFFVIAAVAFELLLSSILGSTVQANRATIEARIHDVNESQSSQVSPSSPNVITNALSQIAGDIGQSSAKVEVQILSGTVSVATGLTRVNTDIEHGAFVAAMFTVHGVYSATIFTAHIFYAATLFTVHTEESTMESAVRIVGRSASDTANTTGSGASFIGDSIRGTFDFNMHMASDVVGLAYGITNVGTLIQPTDSTPVPTITELRAQQASIIQSGTKDVSIASLTTGSGGACDNGDGNGGYPMAWCNAPMDTVATVPYTSDPINRECTSYAYWYFTVVEGHTDFRVWDNAKYWASTSNYPSHAMPAVGSLAVETAGAYGHVAVVQALPGQSYHGEVVPAGYLLVSEMNYDWQGHFRYSYSPLSKFSAYIYP